LRTFAIYQRFTSTNTPVSQGPKIGLKVSSEVITNEYAKADPIYVEKTIVRLLQLRNLSRIKTLMSHLSPRLFPRHILTTELSKAMETVAGEVS
jgi:hypothetical protein